MKRETEKIEEQHFDLIVIGGGVTGAAIAYEAASRGLSVALFEKNDFGGATSAATSKMIHGGLRYLAKMELKLVRESLRERKILCNIAPNFVHPFPYLLASYTSDKTPGWMLKMAMIIYDLLSFDKNWLRDKSKLMPRHKSISKEKIVKDESQVLQNGLQHSQIYYDCLNFSPERLTLAFVKSAVKYGAKVLNYAEVKSLLFKEKQQVSGVKIYDEIGRKEFQVYGNYVINCTGPWVDLLLQKALGNKVEKTLKRSEGIHVITTQKVEKYIVTLTTKSGRHCFVVPWRNYTLLGTTDKEFVGHPDEYRVTKKSVLEFINEVNEVFGEKDKFSYSDVKYVYGGLRPLVEDQTENVYESSRKYEIVNHKKDGIQGLLTVEGGKYTTSRSLAENTINVLSKMSNLKIQKSVSKKQFLEGCALENTKDFILQQQLNYPEYGKCQLEYLAKMYGTEIKELLELAEKENLKTRLNSDGELEAQVIYAIQNEMAVKLSDIFMRRTGIGTVGNPGEQVLKRVAELAAKELNWKSEKQAAELAEMSVLFKLPE